MRWAEMRQIKKPEDCAYSLLGIFDVSIFVTYGEGEKKAFRRLQRDIREKAGIMTRSPHTHWMVSRTANSLFTGRHDLLRELEDTVRDTIHCPWDRAQYRVVLSGIGGQSKSEVCLQLASRLRSMFRAVLWIDIGTEDIAKQSLIEAARRLNLCAQDWKDALDYIANLSQPWLFILDSADDPEVDYRQYFPDGRCGVILMTTRNQECEQYATDQGIALPGLDTQEAQELLLKAVQIPTNLHSQYNEVIQQVATLLQSHALALVQAGAYIARGHCTLADYPRVFKRQRQRLLTFRPRQARSRYGDVYATFEVSAGVLARMNTLASRDAVELLPLLAVCTSNRFLLFLFTVGWQGAKEVPLDLDDEAEDREVMLLTPWHIARLPAVCNVSSETWDGYRLVEAVGLLKAFSLVSTILLSSRTYLSTH